MSHSAMIERPVQDRTISATVVSAIAELTESDPGSIKPLYKVIDPDALERLFNQDQGHIRFTYNGCDVAISADGVVHVSHSDSGEIKEV